MMSSDGQALGTDPAVELGRIEPSGSLAFVEAEAALGYA